MITEASPAAGAQEAAGAAKDEISEGWKTINNSTITKARSKEGHIFDCTHTTNVERVKNPSNNSATTSPPR